MDKKFIVIPVKYKIESKAYSDSAVKETFIALNDLYYRQFKGNYCNAIASKQPAHVSGIYTEACFILLYKDGIHDQEKLCRFIFFVYLKKFNPIAHDIVKIGGVLGTFSDYKEGLSFAIKEAEKHHIL